MMTTTFPIRRCAVALVLLGSLGAMVSTGVAQDGQAAAAGRALYSDFGCYQCHGYQGQGSSASPPVPRIAPTVYPIEAFSAFVRTPVRLMPAYSPNVLSDAQLQEIYDFMQSIPEPPAVEDIPALRDL
jgi:mono/diheme cytochrome c family protein